MLQIERQRDVTVVQFGTLYDSLDEEIIDEIGVVLFREAKTADPPLIVLDLSNTKFFGSHFIEVLIRAWKLLKKRGGTLVLCSMSPFCTNVLKTAKLTSLWDHYDTCEEAVASLVK
jgi:anti-anti-sigma factor